MKKILFLMGAVLTISTSSFAQTPTSQGNVIIDPYIGVLQSNVLRQEPSFSGSNVTNYKLNGGQLAYGGRVSYMVADNFGIGVDVNYVKSGANYDVTDTAVGSSTYNYDYTSQRLRAMLRMNYHFVSSDRVDAYTGFAVGYKHANRVWTVEDPSANTDDLEQDRALVPVAFRFSLGTRIYFTDNIGMMIELGAGGGTPIQFGLTAKF